MNMITSLFPQLLAFQLLAPFILRLVLAAVFIVHGYPKLFKDLAGTAGFLESLGFRPAKMWAIILGFVEFFGGILLLIGLFTQAVAALIAFVMFMAIWKVGRSRGFVGGYEFELALFAMAVSLIFTGPGAFAFDLPF
jgi:putative oxidoreductase